MPITTARTPGDDLSLEPNLLVHFGEVSGQFPRRPK
jgi:hypothetical protein